MAKKRILLSEADFQHLVSGKVVEKNDVQIMLQDIGFDRMYACVTKAIEEVFGD